MPIETQDAVNWAFQQQYEVEPGLNVHVSIDMPFTVVDKVREYFNTNGIVYSTFSYYDLKPYLPS